MRPSSIQKARYGTEWQGGDIRGIHSILVAAESSINDKIGIHNILLAAEQEILAGLAWNENSLRTELTGIIMNNAQQTAERVCGACVEEVKNVLGGHEANTRRSMGNVGRRMSGNAPLRQSMSPTRQSMSPGPNLCTKSVVELRRSMSPRLSRSLGDVCQSMSPRLSSKSIDGGNPADRIRSASRDAGSRRSRSASPIRSESQTRKTTRQGSVSQEPLASRPTRQSTSASSRRSNVDRQSMSPRSSSPRRMSTRQSAGVRQSMRPSAARQSVRKSLAGGLTDAAAHVRRASAKIAGAIELFSANPGSARAGGQVDSQIHAVADAIVADVLVSGADLSFDQVDKAEVAAEYIAALTEALARQIDDLEAGSASRKSMSAAAQECVDTLAEAVFGDLAREGEVSANVAKLQRETHSVVEEILEEIPQSVRPIAKKSSTPASVRQSVRPSTSGAGDDTAKHVKRVTSKMADVIQDLAVVSGVSHSSDVADQIHALAEAIVSDVLDVSAGDARHLSRTSKANIAEAAHQYIAQVTEDLLPTVHDLGTATGGKRKSTHIEVAATAQDCLDNLTVEVFAAIAQQTGESTVVAEAQRKTEADVAELLEETENPPKSAAAGRKSCVRKRLGDNGGKSGLWKKRTQDFADAVEVRTYQPGMSIRPSSKGAKQIQELAEKIVADVYEKAAEEVGRKSAGARASKAEVASEYIAALTESLLPTLDADSASRSCAFASAKEVINEVTDAVFADLSLDGENRASIAAAKSETHGACEEILNETSKNGLQSFSPSVRQSMRPSRASSASHSGELRMSGN